MSAAEKLGRLDRAMMEAPWHDQDPPVDDLGILRNALPQIVVVVEAAQGTGWPVPDRKRLDAALAALEEALL